MILSPMISLALALQQTPERRPLGEQEAREVHAIFREVYQNWNVHCDIPGIDDVRVAFDLELDANGSIIGQPVLVRPVDTPAYRAVADSARRALLDSAPFDVPEDYQGGSYRPTFVPGRLCREADED